MFPVRHVPCLRALRENRPRSFTVGEGCCISLSRRFHLDNLLATAQKDYENQKKANLQERTDVRFPWKTEPRAFRRKVTAQDPRFLDLPVAAFKRYEFESQRKHPRGAGERRSPLEEPIELRNSCPCSMCVDPSTGQRNFSTADIPSDITFKSVSLSKDDALAVKWHNDVLGFGEDHVSHYDQSKLKRFAVGKKQSIYVKKQVHWNKSDMTKKVLYLDYEDYMHNKDSLLMAAFKLYVDGLIFIKNVPTKETSVSTIAEKLGPVRNTFYGSTWDVRSIPNAKNLAYTSRKLVYHMDLLYMDNPPEIQFLHSMANTCSGGETSFVDTAAAVDLLQPHHLETLTKCSLCYEYDNDGHYYRRLHPVISGVGNKKPARVRWSPPFEGTGGAAWGTLKAGDVEALKAFSEILEREDMAFQTRLEEGTCAIFDNLRIAHARREFDAEGGERWLKGCYVDGDAFRSKLSTSGILSMHKETAEQINRSWDTSKSLGPLSEIRTSWEGRDSFWAETRNSSSNAS